MHRTERLKPILANLDAQHYSDLREAYYKAAEGLASLQRLLEEASELHRGLAGELRHVRDAKREFDRCGLGEIL
jgi:hypothetical protein